MMERNGEIVAPVQGQDGRRLSAPRSIDPTYGQVIHQASSHHCWQ
ncbi:MAG TPA: hypothetical protein VN749_05795 [Candidatus Eisenbacteria bacterium]|jgi:hypothetical protein|nr:hypothetical protein [Candidatus Eisenbacteria bacterium]